jgi:diaminopimelate epimerase
MKLKFTKMHGAGNDFIVIDAINQPIDVDGFGAALWRQLADRRFGIGADQILVVERPDQDGVDFRYRIFNNDGGEVEQCGNGSRAFVRFVVDKGLTTEPSIRVQTMSGIINPRLEEDGNVTVDMGAPRLVPGEVPFDSAGLDGLPEADDTLWPLTLSLPSSLGAQAPDAQAVVVPVSVVSMGNPHAVQVVDDVDAAPVEQTGPLIESHARFPKRVNAGYMQIVDRHHIRLRVYERGAGETLACGTGACAAAVAGIRRGLLDSPVRVSARGGELSISWAGPGQPVYLSGPAVSVFEGEIEI